MGTRPLGVRDEAGPLGRAYSGPNIPPLRAASELWTPSDRHGISSTGLAVPIRAPKTAAEGGAAWAVGLALDRGNQLWARMGEAPPLP